MAERAPGNVPGPVKELTLLLPLKDNFVNQRLRPVKTAFSREIRSGHPNPRGIESKTKRHTFKTETMTLTGYDRPF